MQERKKKDNAILAFSHIFSDLMLKNAFFFIPNVQSSIFHNFDQMTHLLHPITQKSWTQTKMGRLPPPLLLYLAEEFG